MFIPFFVSSFVSVVRKGDSTFVKLGPLLFDPQEPPNDAHPQLPPGQVAQRNALK